MSLKIFEVSIDNDPGQWKSGYDKKILVISETKEDAEQKVRDGWNCIYEHDKVKYGIFPDVKHYIGKDAIITAYEVYFPFNHIEISDRDSIINDLIKEE